MFRPLILTCTALGLIFTQFSAAESPAQKPAPRYAHFSIGDQHLDEAWTIEDLQGQKYSGDIDKLRSLGFTLQTPMNQGKLQYGWEGGASLAYERNTTFFLYVDGGATGSISVDSDLWTGDLSAGGFISLAPTDWLRFYLSAGPQLYWGLVKSKDDEPEIEPYTQQNPNNNATIIIDTSNDDSDFGVGLYGRAGVDLILSNGFIIGASVRQTTTDLDFSAHGDVDLQQPLYQLTLGHRF